MEPGWVPKAIATAFLFLAVPVMVLAERCAAAVLKRLDPHVVTTTKRITLTLFTAFVTAGATALGAALSLLEIR